MEIQIHGNMRELMKVISILNRTDPDTKISIAEHPRDNHYGERPSAETAADSLTGEQTPGECSVLSRGMTSVECGTYVAGYYAALFRLMRTKTVTPDHMAHMTHQNADELRLMCKKWESISRAQQRDEMTRRIILFHEGGE